MNKLKILFLSVLFIAILTLPVNVSAQNYRFEVTFMEVIVYVEEDGTLSIFYEIDFQNMAGAKPIDFVDIGMPNNAYSLTTIQASVNDTAITKIEHSPYVENGFALELGSNAIQPGQSGTVTIWIPGVKNVLRAYDQPDRENYASFQFSPTWFDKDFEKSTSTEYWFTIVLPPGVGNEEGVYYEPQNWPGDSTPVDIGRTAEGDRVYYTWNTNRANGHTKYIFGGAFPKAYVPEGEVYATPPRESRPLFMGLINFLFQNFCCFGTMLFFIAAFGYSIYQGTVGANKRKMQYLPPKMKIEGNGIKRGLTAVEAAILMEQPMDKILTMILFGVLKKEAATVITENPLELEVEDPLPAGLHPYEEDFLKAFKETGAKRRAAMQKMMVDFVKTISEKMKGFSQKETIAYYEDIMRRAWKMVEEADTPEVKSEKYNDTLEWTMLDNEYEDRTRRTFTGGPVFVPMWWPRYSPSYRRGIGGSAKPGPMTSQSAPSIGGTRPSLPNIPGSNFAANIINGSTGMAAGVIGNLTSFTGAITNRTNPIPASTRSSSGGGFRGGGGSSCACACACAGCACACAGGGR